MQSLVLFFETTFLVDCLRVKGLQEQVIDLLFLRLTNNFILLKPDIAFKLIDFNQKGVGNMLLFLSVIIWKLSDIFGKKRENIKSSKNTFPCSPWGKKKKKRQIRNCLGQSIQNGMTQSFLKGGLSFKIEQHDVLCT